MPFSVKVKKLGERVEAVVQKTDMKEINDENYQRDFAASLGNRVIFVIILFIQIVSCNNILCIFSNKMSFNPQCIQ